MRFKAYLLEKKKELTPESLQAMHDKIKQGKWVSLRRGAILSRGEMGKVLNQLKELRDTIVEFYQLNRGEGKFWRMRGNLAARVRLADQLRAYARDSMKIMDVTNFLQQADRALMNLHGALSTITGEKWEVGQ